VPDDAKLLDLRKLLAERFPHSFIPRAAQFATGIATLDQATSGGLPQGAITELTSAHASAGSASLIGELLRTAQRQHCFVALIDGRDSFDPCGVADNSLLRHLFWLRCRTAGESLRAADLLLRDGNFKLIVLDLVLNPPNELCKIPQTSWYRLQRLVEPSPTALLVLTRRALIASAQLKLQLDHRWRLADLEEENIPPARLRLHVERAQGAWRKLREKG
jgi:hypothetical protein